VERYIQEYEMKRVDTVAHLKSSVYNEAALQLAAAKNVEVKVLFPQDQLKG